jgi:hypothetical protein
MIISTGLYHELRFENGYTIRYQIRDIYLMLGVVLNGTGKPIECQSLLRTDKPSKMFEGLSADEFAELVYAVKTMV